MAENAGFLMQYDSVFDIKNECAGLLFPPHSLIFNKLD